MVPGHQAETPTGVQEVVREGRPATSAPAQERAEAPAARGLGTGQEGPGAMSVSWGCSNRPPWPGAGGRGVVAYTAVFSPSSGARSQNRGVAVIPVLPARRHAAPVSASILDGPSGSP